jgi:hypothetical protein
MILILERSFRYQGKYVSVKQIEDAAVYYTTAMTTTFAGKELLLQKHVHDEVDRLIPLTKFSASIRFSKLRPGLEDIIHKNRFLKTDSEKPIDTKEPSVPELGGSEVAELDGASSPVELAGQKFQPVELPADNGYDIKPAYAEKEVVSSGNGSATGTSTTADDLLSNEEKSTISQTFSGQSPTTVTRQTTFSPTSEPKVERTKSDTMSRTRKWSSKLGLRKSKTVQE